MTPQMKASLELANYEPKQYETKNTTPEFRAAAAFFAGEKKYGELHNKSAKAWGHVSKFPVSFTKQGGMAARNIKGKPTVRQMIANALKSGQKTRSEIAVLIGKSDSHVSAELSDLRRTGIVAREVRKVDGFNTPVWSLT